MVIARLMGGLGNQLFQYAAGRRLAHARSSLLKLDISDCGPRAKRQYRLHHFNVTQTVATPAELARFRGKSPRALWTRIGDRFRPYARRRRLRERHFHFDPAILDAGGDVYLSGYWQSERYFTDVAGLLRREITWRAQPDAPNAAMAERIRAVAAVSLHVRRGDYLTNPAALALHGVCSPAYYTAAVARVVAATPDAHFFVFSDEPEWAWSNMRLGRPTTFVTLNGPDGDYEDLRLMSLCRHHVIANSSFSWWAAWLAARSDSLVIAPRRWFADPTNDTSDLIPARWLRL
jgi:Glycosyl transferase family 11